MTAEQFVNITLGGEDPINGGYLEYSLNLEALALCRRITRGTRVSVDAATAGNLLYGPRE